MQEQMLGGCLCGAIRYQTGGRPTDAGYCHCRVCQRSSGAPTLAWVTVPLESFAYTRGSVAAFASSEHAHREFCAHCGTQLVFRDRLTPDTIDITLASLDDPRQIEPQYHIWCESRLPWVKLSGDLPAFQDAGPDGARDA